MKQKIKKIISFIAIISLMFFSVPLKVMSASALSDIMSRLQDSADSNHTIEFTAGANVDAGETITITFPLGFNTALVDYTDIDVADDGTDLTLAATASGTTWGAVFGGTDSRTLTITSGTGTIASGSVIVVEIGTNATYGVAGDQAINNQTVAQNNSDPKITIGGTWGDSGAVAVEIVSNDQVTMTATVDPTITFTLSANASSFGTLSTSSTTPSSNIILTTSTNANSGFTITVRDEGDGANPGMYSSGANYLIPSTTATLSAGTEGYGIQGATNANGSGGTVTLSATYNKSGDNVGGLSRTPQTLATASAPVNLREVVVSHKASISGLTRAGSYVDTLTYICTGNF